MKYIFWKSSNLTFCMHVVFQQKNILKNSVMRSLVCFHFWIGRHLLKLKLWESSKKPQALAVTERSPVKDSYVWMGVGWVSHVAQGLFVHQFRISGEGQDQRVCTLFPHAAAGALPLLSYVRSRTWKTFSPSRKCHQLSASHALHWSPWSHLGMWPQANRFLWENVFQVSNSWFITTSWEYNLSKLGIICDCSIYLALLTADNELQAFR